MPRPKTVRKSPDASGMESMTATMSFKDLARALAGVGPEDDVPGSGTREELRYIDIDLVDDDPRNFYELSGIEELAENIELFGIQQPLRLRDDPLDPDRKIVVSGHRRKAAARLLVDAGNEKFRMLPYIQVRDAGSEAAQELLLIYENMDNRKLSSVEISRQAERVEALLYQLKEEGYDFPGRMRDHVAEACKVSKSKLSRLKVIREGLDDWWAAKWEEGKVAEETAYQVARLSEEGQRYARITAQAKSRIEYFYASTAAEVGAALAKLDEKRPDCPHADGAPCPHLDAMKERTAKEDKWWSNPCAGKCCINCWDLDICKYSCEHAKPEKARIKQARKEANANRKAAEEELARPGIEKNRVLWRRMAEARAAAGRSAKEVFDACGRYWSEPNEKGFLKHEAGEEKLTASDQTPYGYMFSASDAVNLCAVADLLGVTTDYLLGREEANETAAAPAWQTGTPPKDGMYWVRVETDGASSCLSDQWISHLGHFFGLGDEAFTVTGWWPLPEED